MWVQLNETFSDATLPVVGRDGVVTTGTLCVFDAGKLASFPRAANPVNLDACNDLSFTGANGVASIATPNALAFSGNGFDHTALVPTSKDCIVFPASIMASLYNGGTNHDWLSCIYIKTPTAANWNSTGSIQSILRCNPAGNYADVPDHHCIAFGSYGGLQTRIQKTVGTATVLAPEMTTQHKGKLVQVAVWVKSGTAYCRIKSSDGEHSASAAHTGNTANFSTCTPLFGSIGTALNYNIGGDNTLKIGLKIYRWWLESLTTSGRDALTVINADYTRVTTRGQFV